MLCFLIAESLIRIFCKQINRLYISANLFTPRLYGDSYGLAKNVEGYAYGAKVVTDNYGFRINPKNGFNNPKDSRPAIIFLGDSITFGIGVKSEHTFTEIYHKSNKNRKIINGGIIGYNAQDYKNFVDFFIVKQKIIST